MVGRDDDIPPAMEKQLAGSLGREEYVHEKTELARLQKEEAQLRVDEKRGKLVDAEESLRVWGAVLGAHLTRVDNFPRLMRAKFPGLSGDVWAYLERLIREAREDVANGSDGGDRQ